MEADLALVKEMLTLEDMEFTQFKNSFEMAQAIKIANSSQNKQTAQV
jgi:hypothetical protein